MLLDLLTVVVLAWVGTRLFEAARVALAPGPRAHIAEIVRGLRPHHFLLALPVLGAVVVTYSLLLQIPGLSFGWWTAIGGEGNPVVGVTSRTSGTAWERIVPAVFLLLLVPALPLLVEREEQIFRRGSEHRTFGQRALRGVLFGLVHALVGIPIAAALALSIGGWYMTWAYVRGFRRGGPEAALLESTRAHLAYNSVIVGLLAAAIATGDV
jgi:hypothetical protein